MCTLIDFPLVGRRTQPYNVYGGTNLCKVCGEFSCREGAVNTGIRLQLAVKQQLLFTVFIYMTDNLF